MEDLILFKTSKLAFSKGFNEYTKLKYTLNNKYFDKGELFEPQHCSCHSEDDYCSCGFPEELEYYRKECIPAPTQSHLQKWLRKVHNIYVTPKINDSLSKRFDERSNIEVKQWKWYIYTNINDKDFMYEFFNSKVNYDTYEESLEIGLQEALKLCTAIKE